MSNAARDHRPNGHRCSADLRLLTVAMLGHAAIAGALEPAGTAGAVGAADAPSALVAQALALEHGEGVPKDQLRAVALYCEAARDGDAEAQFSLGWMYANGRGVARDDAIAASLFALAASAGHAQAQKMLGFVGDERASLPECMRVRPVAQADADTTTAEEPDPFAELSPAKRKIANLVAKLAPRFAIDPRLALSVITVESNFEPGARSVKDARGLMQLLPETAARFNVGNPYDVGDNVRGGLAYLRWLLAYYQGHVALAAAAYNAGEATVDRYRGIPPYPETRDYVQRVLRLFRSDRHAYDPRIAAPSPFLSHPGTL